MTAEMLRQVESVCPDCLRRISGQLVRSEQTIRLEKNCPDHGPFAATVWQGEPEFSSWFRPKIPFFGGERQLSGKGCPYDCGLCENHTQRTCTTLVEITSRCNLNCPVCFADSGGAAADPDLDNLGRMFAAVMAQTGGCNLQISGGEPTVRDDLPRIVRLAREVGFTFIQLNSNGIRLADDPQLAPRLKAEGLSSVFLQFDGVRDKVFRTLRGRELFAEKCRAIDNLAAAGIGVVLVPTIARGVNTEQLWEIVRFGLEHQPHVRGVHFQPMSYFGRFPADFVPDHVTLPELMSGLARQSCGVVQVEDFRPPGCEHALCSFAARYLGEVNGQLRRLGGGGCECGPRPAEEGALQSIGVTARQWGGVRELSGPARPQPLDELDRFLQRARTHTFSISGMAFQDCWTLNLERLQGCCIHVAQPDGRLIPFCGFNLTARDGRPLHRPAGPRVGERGNMKRTPVDGLTARRLALEDSLTRAELERGQLLALKNTVEHAILNSPFYQKHLGSLDKAIPRSLSDLPTLPFLSRDHIVEQGHLMLSVSQSKVARIITMQTSGSTGTPKRLAFSVHDLASTSDFFLHGMYSLIDRSDRVLVLLPFTLPASVGELLIAALGEEGIIAEGMWPPASGEEMAGRVRAGGYSCTVGLPQHLLALSAAVPKGELKSMLLCSDYAPVALRRRIEENCGCETFLHYGATESGLGGAVECGAHDGCHIRESDLLIEIIDPLTGKVLPDGKCGEVALTTLNREAMPLIRYRTGDLASLDRSGCACGGVTARLKNIRGRMEGRLLSSGALVYSQDIDAYLFEVPGLLDYRLSLVTAETRGRDRLELEFQALPGNGRIEGELVRSLGQVPAIRAGLAAATLEIGAVRQVEAFAALHTQKRTIVDQRTQEETHAPCT